MVQNYFLFEKNKNKKKIKQNLNQFKKNIKFKKINRIKLVAVIQSVGIHVSYFVASERVKKPGRNYGVNPRRFQHKIGVFRTYFVEFLIEQNHAILYIGLIKVFGFSQYFCAIPCR